MRWAEVPHRTFSEVLHSLIYNIYILCVCLLYIVRMPSARPKESFGPRTSECHKINLRANTLHDRNGMTHRGRITDSLSVRPMVLPADFSRFPPFWTIWTISFLPTPFSIPSHFPFETF